MVLKLVYNLNTMMTYLKRNPMGNSVVSAFLVSLVLISLFRFSSIKLGLGIAFVLPIIFIITAVLSYALFSKNNTENIQQNIDSFYEPVAEKAILFVWGLIALFVFIYGIRHFSESIKSVGFWLWFLWLVTVLTRQWSMLKRIVWILIPVSIIMFIFSQLPQYAVVI